MSSSTLQQHKAPINQDKFHYHAKHPYVFESTTLQMHALEMDRCTIVQDALGSKGFLLAEGGHLTLVSTDETVDLLIVLRDQEWNVLAMGSFMSELRVVARELCAYTIIFPKGDVCELILQQDNNPQFNESIALFEFFCSECGVNFVNKDGIALTDCTAEANMNRSNVLRVGRGEPLEPRELNTRSGTAMKHVRSYRRSPSLPPSKSRSEWSDLTPFAFDAASKTKALAAAVGQPLATEPQGTALARSIESGADFIANKIQDLGSAVGHKMHEASSTLQNRVIRRRGNIPVPAPIRGALWLGRKVTGAALGATNLVSNAIASGVSTTASVVTRPVAAFASSRDKKGAVKHPWIKGGVDVASATARGIGNIAVSSFQSIDNVTNDLTVSTRDTVSYALGPQAATALEDVLNTAHNSTKTMANFQGRRLLRSIAIKSAKQTVRKTFPSKQSSSTAPLVNATEAQQQQDAVPQDIHPQRRSSTSLVLDRTQHPRYKELGRALSEQNLPGTMDEEEIHSIPSSS